MSGVEMSASTMSASYRIVLTGGGTGGHVTPNMALIPYLKEEGADIRYIGSVGGMEKNLIEPLGIPYYGIDTARLHRYLTPKNLLMPFHVIHGITQAKKLLKQMQPDVVFSKGGFVSVPVVYAAHKLHIPVVCHESDLTPGLANKLSTPYAEKICVNFQEALAYVANEKGVYTGTPIRDELLRGSREEGLEICGFTADKPVLLVMGGSSGAQALNEGVRKALPKLLPRFQIAHLCGRGNADLSLSGQEGYCQIEYANEEMPHLYAAADVTLCRAGANSLAEILALHLPNVLVPLPKAASRGDQILNAQSFEKKGFSIVLEQENMTDDTILAKVSEAYENREKYRQKMAEDPAGSGTQRVLAVIHEALKEGK